MVYITGDTHGDVKRFNRVSFPEQRQMTKDDYVIVLGDFGVIWDYKGESRYEKHWLDWLDSKSFTTLFIDGNHENHDRLDAMSVEKWHGGKVHRIRSSVIHLMRGQIFDVEGLKLFTFGGASSHDIKDGILEPGDPRIKRWSNDYYKSFRVNKQSWWERELPSESEMAEGLQNLDKVGWKVDYVLTHCASASTTTVLSQDIRDQDVLTRYLQDIKEKLTYRGWFFGHHHVDKDFFDKECCLYEQIVRLH
ncbi:MAG: metallophosphoesterase [Eubacterium sp.]|nr:metallophosphoesterase [Eubacterium sp.]